MDRDLRGAHRLGAARHEPPVILSDGLSGNERSRADAVHHQRPPSYRAQRPAVSIFSLPRVHSRRIAAQEHSKPAHPTATNVIFFDTALSVHKPRRFPHESIWGGRKPRWDNRRGMPGFYEPSLSQSPSTQTSLYSHAHVHGTAHRPHPRGQQQRITWSGSSAAPSARSPAS